MSSISQDPISYMENMFAAHQQWLCERLYQFVNGLQPQLCDDAVRALEEPGKLLFPGNAQDSKTQFKLPTGHWALLPLLVARTIDPAIDIQISGIVAIAVECLICAFDLLDDIEDDDQTAIVEALGPARVLNTSTALLMLL